MSTKSNKPVYCYLKLSNCVDARLLITFIKLMNGITSTDISPTLLNRFSRYKFKYNKKTSHLLVSPGSKKYQLDFYLDEHFNILVNYRDKIYRMTNIDYQVICSRLYLMTDEFNGKSTAKSESPLAALTRTKLRYERKYKELLSKYNELTKVIKLDRGSIEHKYYLLKNRYNKLKKEHELALKELELLRR